MNIKQDWAKFKRNIRVGIPSALLFWPKIIAQAIEESLLFFLPAAGVTLYGVIRLLYSTWLDKSNLIDIFTPADLYAYLTVLAICIGIFLFKLIVLPAEKSLEIISQMNPDIGLILKVYSPVRGLLILKIRNKNPLDFTHCCVAIGKIEKGSQTSDFSEKKLLLPWFRKGFQEPWREYTIPSYMSGDFTIAEWDNKSNQGKLMMKENIKFCLEPNESYILFLKIYGRTSENVLPLDRFMWVRIPVSIEKGKLKSGKIERYTNI